MLRPDPCVARRLIFTGLPEPSLLSSPDSFFSFPSKEKSHLLYSGTRNSYLLHLLHLSVPEDTLEQTKIPFSDVSEAEDRRVHGKPTPIKEHTLRPLASPWALKSFSPEKVSTLSFFSTDVDSFLI